MSRDVKIAAYCIAMFTLFLLLTACGGAVTHETVVRVPVPVAQPCVNGTRPADVMPLNKQYTDQQWAALDAKQKAAAVGRNGLERKTYGEQLNAITSACP